MAHVMPKLPYAADALAPVMSKETIDYHMVNICRLISTISIV